MNLKIMNKILTSTGEDSFFVGVANGERINTIEAKLGVTLPNSYKWFLHNYGHGGITGVEIIGNGLGINPACVDATIEWRKFGLPEKLVVIEDEGTDWIYCLDTSRLENYECPVVDWEQGKGYGKIEFPSFISFLFTRFTGQ